LEELLVLINQTSLSLEEDYWVRRLDKDGLFSVKSTYMAVANMLITGSSVTPEEGTTFKAIWKCNAPSKVSALLWKLLHDRIPTNVNLYRIRILRPEDNQACAFCGNCAETSLNLLLYCDFALAVWQCVFDWLGLKLSFSHNFQSLLNFTAAVTGRKVMKQALVMVWVAVIWALWNHRNQIVYENGRPKTAVVIEMIKYSSWKWWIKRSAQSPCLVYEWLSEPLVCMEM
jgi:hypothetical protein